MSDSAPKSADKPVSHKWLVLSALVAGVAAPGVVLWLLYTRILFPPADRQANNSGQPAQPAVMKDYSASNIVTLRLGQESLDDGLAHLDGERDGRTTIETLDGVLCRHHNRRPENKSFGYVYFVIHPDFKRDGLRTARIEIEFLTPEPSYLRLQYDGMEGEMHKPYRSVVAEARDSSSTEGQVRFSPVGGSKRWQTAAFLIKDAVFLNAQNGGADFRLEVTPPEIYLRRVSVIREGSPPAVPRRSEAEPPPQ